VCTGFRFRRSNRGGARDDSDPRPIAFLLEILGPLGLGRWARFISQGHALGTCSDVQSTALSLRRGRVPPSSAVAPQPMYWTPSIRDRRRHEVAQGRRAHTAHVSAYGTRHSFEWCPRRLSASLWTGRAELCCLHRAGRRARTARVGMRFAILFRSSSDTYCRGQDMIRA
jgi:hypothetical protein